MNRGAIARPRRGLGLAEMLVAIVIMGIIGGAAVRAFVSQTRFADQQHKKRAARAVSRSAVNLLLSEVRMVENGSGVAAASATSGASSITLRVPLAMGLVCGASGGGTAISMMPTDSVALASAALSGNAYRLASGAYAYTEIATTQVSGGAAACTAANITTPTGGRTVVVTPALPAGAAAGTVAFVYQRVRYSFGNSTANTGRLGLWRTLEATNVSEELAAPFDSSSRIRFFRNNNDTSDVTVPTLTQITGVEFLLSGASEKTRYGKTTPEVATLRTAAFFSNRVN
jgi:prepilin-type N-terminal cleavage/methylation domain-containing protein